MKKRKLAISITASCLVIISLVVFCVVKNSSKASRNREIKTGENLSTIAEVEDYTGTTNSSFNREKSYITTYIGYGYNVATKGYIHENNVNKSAVDNMIFNISTSSGADNNIRDTYVKIDNCSRTIEKETIDGRSIEGYMKEFKANLAAKKFSFTDKLNWIPFVNDIYAEVGGKFNRTSLSSSKTAYITDTMTKKTSTVTWMLEEKDYYQYLTDNFKKDVMELEPEELFSKYGTHFFRSVVLGGKLKYTATIKADSEKTLNEASATFKTSVNNSENSNKDKVTCNGYNWCTEEPKDTVSYNNGNQNTNMTIDCKAYCYGGLATSYNDKFGDVASKIASIVLNKVTNEKSQEEYSYMNNEYSTWLTSVDNAPALIDVIDQYSLYPIWDLLDYFPDNDPTISDEKVKERKEELEKAFDEYGLENYNSIIKKYENEVENSLFTEIESEVTGVRYLSSYDKRQKLSDEKAEIHKDFKLGNMYVTNAGKTSAGKYMLNDSSFEVSYKLAQDPYNLPLSESFAKKYVKHSLVSDVSYLGKVNGYGDIFSFWKQFAPLKGGYYVQVVYNDNQTDCTSGNNLLKKKNNGDSMVMYTSKPSEVEKHGGVSEIKVLFLYKTQAISNVTFSSSYKWLQEGSIKFQ